MLKIDNSNRYDDCVVYAIVCKDKKVKDCYVGSTTNFDIRKARHRSACDNPNANAYPCKVYKFIRSNGGMENFKFKILEEPDVITSRQLHDRERHYVDKLKPTLNKQLPNRTKKQFYIDNKKVYIERSKQRYIDNKKVYIERSKQRYIDNKKAYNERNKQRYIDNRDRIIEQKKQKVICCCGRSYTKSVKARHNKTKFHINYIDSTSSDSTSSDSNSN